MSDELARSIGERVQFYRTATRRTKTVVAGLTGITPDYLYQIERGQKVPTVAVLAQLANVLGVSTSELLGSQPRRDTARIKTAAGNAIYQALTTAPPPCDAPPAIPELRRRIHEAWTTWQTSPRRYSQLTAQLPALIADTEQTVRARTSERISARRARYGCAADLYGLLRTVTKRIGRVDLSLLAADRRLARSDRARRLLHGRPAWWPRTGACPTHAPGGRALLGVQRPRARELAVRAGQHRPACPDDHHREAKSSPESTDPPHSRTLIWALAALALAHAVDGLGGCRLAPRYGGGEHRRGVPAT